MPSLPELPVLSVLPELLKTLSSSTEAVLQAPPGAGKTTVVPLALKDEQWLSDKKIILLEPRRLAARGAAWRMAELSGEEVGASVGYRMRGERRVSSSTRIEVVTEGILTRMLQNDPSLERVGAVIFDEFHERSLHADLGLALTLQTQELFRPDLRILVMSATLDGQPISNLLGNAAIITSEGQTYPVETIYAGREPDRSIDEQAARTVSRALREEPLGDVLVFLPGYGEIQRTAARLQELTQHGSVEVHRLHGSLSREAQDQAIHPAKEGIRKVVLATSIAETSLTIEGVRIVIDTGLSRVPRFSPRNGMTHLETVKSSLASADQRRGRAGRLGPGRCYRLWDRAENKGLPPGIPPEILEADLSPLALELARWGSAPDELRWLTPPPQGTYQAARELLRGLDTLDSEGNLTDHGKLMSGLPVHPRLAHLIVRAQEQELTGLGCVLASLLEERDILRGDRARQNPDISLRIDILRRFTREGFHSLPADADRNTIKRVIEGAERLSQLMDAGPSQFSRMFAENEPGDAHIGELLALAWPDRIARRNDNGKGQRITTGYTLSNGKRARLPAEDRISNEEFLVVPSLRGSGAEGIIELAAPVDLQTLCSVLSDHIQPVDVVTWLGPEQGVQVEREEQLAKLTLKRTTLHDPDDEAIVNATLEGIRESRLSVLPWTPELHEFCNRITFLHRRYHPDWPSMTNEELLETMEEWLLPALQSTKGRNRLKGLDLRTALTGKLNWEQIRDLEQLAPERLQVPSGSRVRLDYSTPDEPVLPVRLQEMFGATDTPRIAGGRVPVTLHLLSPARRPMQVTQDLAGFWERTYAEVRKELKGRYPKHYWPDNPLEAEPTRRTKPRK